MSVAYLDNSVFRIPIPAVVLTETLWISGLHACHACLRRFLKDQGLQCQREYRAVHRRNVQLISGINSCQRVLSSPCVRKKFALLSFVQLYSSSLYLSWAQQNVVVLLRKSVLVAVGSALQASFVRIGTHFGLCIGHIFCPGILLILRLQICLLRRLAL